MKRICTASLGSLTLAMKARQLAKEASFETTIVKLDPAATRKGCAYGLEFPCEAQRKISTLLSKNKIKVGEYFSGSRGDLF